MPRRDGSSGFREVKRKRRKKLYIDASKQRSRRAKLKNRSHQSGLID